MGGLRSWILLTLTILAGTLLGVSSTPPASADTYISSGTYPSMTWDPAGSPYILSGTVYVIDLTILPGAEVRFNSSAWLDVARLNASGTPTNPIHVVGGGLTRFRIQGGTASDMNITNMRWGIEVLATLSPARIERNVFYGGYGGVKATSTSRVSIENNTFIGPSEGIYLLGSNNITVRNNTFDQGGVYAMQLENSAWNDVADNTISGLQSCFWFTDSHHNEVHRNVMVNSGPTCMSYSATSVGNAFNNISTTNTIDGEPVYFLYGVRDANISGYSSNHVTVVASQRLVIRGDTFRFDGLQVLWSDDIDITGDTWGSGSTLLALSNSNNVTIHGNSFPQSSFRGIRAYGGSRLIVDNNSVDGPQDPLYMESVTDASVTNNTLLGSTASSDYGLRILSSSIVRIKDNVIVGGASGLYVGETDTGTIENNTIMSWAFSSGGFCVRLENTTAFVLSNNTVVRCRMAARLGSSSGNLFIRNAFATAVVPPLDDGSANVWDGGYPVGGNYWAGFSVTDMFSGPVQDQPGGDGFSDLPYSIDADSLDRYPLTTNPVVTQGPSIHSLSVVNNLTRTGTDVTVFLSATDDEGVANVTVGLIAEDGSLLGNYTPTFSWPSSWRQTLLNLSTPGNFTVTAWAMDYWGNLVSASRELTVVDDWSGPTILHTRVSNAPVNETITLSANVTDSRGVASVRVYYQSVGSASFVSIGMTLLGNVTYEGTLPAQTANGTLLYYIRATDDLGNIALSPVEASTAPYAVAITADRDGDGVADADDRFPDDPTEWTDHDGDGIGDNADPDDDADGVPDSEDTFPLDPSESRDTDGDGIGDNADADRDGDLVDNTFDAFPDDPLEWVDTDGDGVGDHADGDDDGDGMPDTWESEGQLDPLSDDSGGDRDSDGLSNLDEYLRGTGVGDPDTDQDGLQDGSDPDPLLREAPPVWIPAIAAGFAIILIVLLMRRRKGRKPQRSSIEPTPAPKGAPAPPPEKTT